MVYILTYLVSVPFRNQKMVFAARCTAGDTGLYDIQFSFKVKEQPGKPVSVWNHIDKFRLSQLYDCVKYAVLAPCPRLVRVCVAGGILWPPDFIRGFAPHAVSRCRNDMQKKAQLSLGFGSYLFE